MKRCSKYWMPRGNVIGLEPRGDAHAKGLWHRAVYCFVFNKRQELLLQRRSARKKIGPRQWDLSVAEHLQPGETYKQGVIRGLTEELGIELGAADAQALVQGPLSPVHQRKLIIPGSFYDFEFVESYRLGNYEGPIDYNAEEVEEVRFCSLQDLEHEMQSSPQEFTDWFRSEISALHFFRGGKQGVQTT